MGILSILTPHQNTHQVVGEPVDVAFYSPENPALNVSSSSSSSRPHPLAQLLPPEALRTAAAKDKPIVFLSVFKVPPSVWPGLAPPDIVTRAVTVTDLTHRSTQPRACTVGGAQGVGCPAPGVL